MNERIEFETPENIKITYPVAGAGTRFLAWFADCVLLTGLCLVLLVLSVLLGVSLDSAFGDMFEAGENADGVPQFSKVFLGIWLMIWSLGSFFYFGLSELIFHGQTIGKRMSRIRVVKSNGFSLDPMSILIRSLFRVVDQIPALWIVPVLSTSSQRLGDMVAGTLVVSDESHEISSVRDTLEKRSVGESKFRFTRAMLNHVRPSDFATIESIMERWSSLSLKERSALTEKIVPALARRLQTEVPPESEYLRFLEDLLAAEYRRQSRSLG